MNNSNNGLFVVLAVLFIMLLFKRTQVEKFTYPYNYSSGTPLNYTSTVYPHSYAGSEFRNKRYGNLKSNYPWLQTQPDGEFKEGFKSISHINGQHKFPYIGPSGRTHYEYDASNDHQNGVNEMVQRYYFNPSPSVKYENWHLNQGPYGTLN